MAITLDATADGMLDLDTFIEWCDGTPALHDFESAPEIASKLKALCANPRLIPDFITGELKNLGDFQKTNTFKPPTFVVHRGKGYTLRAVVWLPLEKRLEPSLFSYFEAHDHNFDFYTCGCFGPGYETDIYEYDPDSIVGLPGEPVAFEFLERTTLPEGKVMYYRASRDIHSQLPPPALSVSFNLILRPKVKLRRQFDFDLEAGRIKAQVDAANWHQALFAASALAGDDKTIKVLFSIAETHPSQTVRSVAWRTLLERLPDDSDQIFAAAMSDESAFVRSAVVQALDRREEPDRGRGMA